MEEREVIKIKRLRCPICGYIKKITATPICRCGAGMTEINTLGYKKGA